MEIGGGEAFERSGFAGEVDGVDDGAFEKSSGEFEVGLNAVFCEKVRAVFLGEPAKAGSVEPNERCD